MAQFMFFVLNPVNVTQSLYPVRSVAPSGSVAVGVGGVL